MLDGVWLLFFKICAKLGVFWCFVLVSCMFLASMYEMF